MVHDSRGNCQLRSLVCEIGNDSFPETYGTNDVVDVRWLMGEGTLNVEISQRNDVNIKFECYG